MVQIPQHSYGELVYLCWLRETVATFIAVVMSLLVLCILASPFVGIQQVGSLAIVLLMVASFQSTLAKPTGVRDVQASDHPLIQDIFYDDGTLRPAEDISAILRGAASRVGLIKDIFYDDGTLRPAEEISATLRGAASRVGLIKDIFYNDGTLRPAEEISATLRGAYNSAALKSADIRQPKELQENSFAPQ